MLLFSKINIFYKIGDELVQNTSISKKNKLHNANTFCRIIETYKSTFSSISLKSINNIHVYNCPRQCFKLHTVQYFYKYLTGNLRYNNLNSFLSYSTLNLSFTCSVDLRSYIFPGALPLKPVIMLNMYTSRFYYISTVYCYNNSVYIVSAMFWQSTITKYERVKDLVLYVIFLYLLGVDFNERFNSVNEFHNGTENYCIK